MEKIKVVKLKDNYEVDWCYEYGFEFDEEKKVYKLGGITIDPKTKQISCSGKVSSTELATLITMFEFNIIEKSFVENEKTINKENIKKNTKTRENA